MTHMVRVKMRWSNFVGGPGYSVFHFRDFGASGSDAATVAEAQAACARVRTFADGLKTMLPYNLTLKVENDVEVIEDSTGELVDILNGGNPLEVLGTAPQATTYAAPVGAVINWRTGLVRNGRRIRGRTFLVPLAGTAYQNDGTLSTGTIQALQTAADALVNSAGTPDLGVYARPTRVTDPNGTVSTASDGMWAAATTATIPDLAAVLRSRRD